MFSGKSEDYKYFLDISISICTIDFSQTSKAKVDRMKSVPLNLISFSYFIRNYIGFYHLDMAFYTHIAVQNLAESKLDIALPDIRTEIFDTRVN